MYSAIDFISSYLGWVLKTKMISIFSLAVHISDKVFYYYDDFFSCRDKQRIESNGNNLYTHIYEWDGERGKEVDILSWHFAEEKKKTEGRRRSYNEVKKLLKAKRICHRRFSKAVPMAQFSLSFNTYFSGNLLLSLEQSHLIHF